MNVSRRVIRMNAYLREVKDRVKECAGKPVLAVIGNESVDLDSAVSSICLAFHFNKFQCRKSQFIPVSKQNEQFIVVPVINASRIDLPLKTEVTHWLKKHQVELDNLLCRDEINLEQVTSFALVDHHMSKFREKVITVLDHRPFDSKSNLPSDCCTIISELGSCATLVSEVIRQDQDALTIKEEYEDVFKLLYGAIVLDCINFSKEADKFRLKDFENAEFIDRMFNVEDTTQRRKDLYDELVAARADVSSLDSLQLLSKDLKIVTGEGGRVAIPGVDVFEFIDMEKAAENVAEFAARENIDVVVLMGLVPVGDSVERFVGFINIKNKDLFSRVSKL